MKSAHLIGHKFDHCVDYEAHPDAISLLFSYYCYFDITKHQLEKDKRAVSEIAKSFGFHPTIFQAILEHNEHLSFLDDFDPYTRKKAWVEWINTYLLFVNSESITEQDNYNEVIP